MTRLNKFLTQNRKPLIRKTRCWSMKKLSLSMIYEADKIIKGWFLPTPIQYCHELSMQHKVPFILKCEQFHPCGSNDLRGAFYYLSLLPCEIKKLGIALCGENDKIIAMAYVASLLNIPCHVYFKKKPSENIVQKLLFYSAQLHIGDYDYIKMSTDDLNLHLITNFNLPSFHASLGGSLAVEIVKQIPQVKNVIVPLDRKELCYGLTFYLKKKFVDLVVVGVTSKKTALCPFVDYHVRASIQNGNSAAKWYEKAHGGIIDSRGAVSLGACLNGLIPKLEGPTCLIIPSRPI